MDFTTYSPALRLGTGTELPQTGPKTSGSLAAGEDPVSGARMALPPAPEWAPHEAVWIGFPSDPELWLGDLKPAEREVAAFAEAVHAGGRGEKVWLVAAHDGAADSAQRLC